VRVVVSGIVLALFVSCAQSRVAALPSSHLRVDGDSTLVSKADMHTVLALALRRIESEKDATLPIESVYVLDHNHILVFYRFRGSIPVALEAKRIRGRWTLLYDLERVPTTGRAI
jgi:hypothetical protein